MSSLAIFFGGIGWLELLVITLLGMGALAVIAAFGLIIYFAVKLGSQPK